MPLESLRPLQFKEIIGFESDNLVLAWDVFRKSAFHINNQDQNLRQDSGASDLFKHICARAIEIKSPQTSSEACDLWMRFFQPYQSLDPDPSPRGFVTAYYEPILKGSLFQTADYSEPVLAFADPTCAHKANSSLWPDRAHIDAGVLADQTKVLVWLKDAVEVFIVQVQGSARIELSDGSQRRLIYAGRNGHLYSSIGKILIERGEIAASDMSSEAIKHWVRQNGQGPQDAGRKLLHENKSYVFFDFAQDLAQDEGPIGGQGISLTPLRSIAIDRHHWFYGLPIWVEAHLPLRTAQEEHFARLMIAQDTGSAIIGEERIDLFFGSGVAAGERAGEIKHPAHLIYLLPKMERSS
jgi:membrane-bound lytic murein transglycosylase A